jgi:hypothetical protein
MFPEWQSSRKNIIAANEETSLKFPGNDSFQDLGTSLKEMNAESLNFWLVKFIEEVAKKDGKHYPPSILYAIACGINRFLAEKRIEENLNIVDRNDKRLVNVYLK